MDLTDAMLSMARRRVDEAGWRNVQLGWPDWPVRFGIRLNRPYDVSSELAERHPWESVRRHPAEVEYEEFFRGAVYLSVRAPGPARDNDVEPAGV